MGKKIHTTVRVDEENFKIAKEILQKMGLNISQAFNIFIALIKEYKGIPFKLELPNSETRQVINEARKGKNLIKLKNVDELKEKLLN